jgi:hypothetical protein
VPSLLLLLLPPQLAGVAAQPELLLPLPLVRSAHTHLLAARGEAAALSRELDELRSSRVQHIPPSTWLKRETRYKMDQEKYEHTIAMQVRVLVFGATAHTLHVDDLCGRM